VCVYVLALAHRFFDDDEVVVSSNLKYVPNLDTVIGVLVRAFGVVVVSRKRVRVCNKGSSFDAVEVVLRKK